MRLLNNTSIGVSLLILFFLYPIHQIHAQVFVDQNANGTNDGSSWANAFRDLQTALTLTSSGQIWVAKGTYKPINCNPCSETERESAFMLPPDVQLYGGFNGNENNLAQRDWKANPTILSGDIGVANDSLDNVFRVLIAVNSTTNTVLDGFVVEEGNADGSFGFSAGGGILVDANPGGTGDIRIRNCTFRNNYAGGGGAVAIDCVLGGVSRALIRDCIFEGNTASFGVTSTGAAIFMQGNSGGQVMPSIVSCIFRDNYCGNDGGAISATPTGAGSLLAMKIDSCLFTNNRANDRGGAIWYRMSSSGESQVIIKNSQFIENESGGEGGAIYARSSFDNIATDTIANCLFSLNRADGSSTINDGEGGAIFVRGSQDGTRNQLIVNSVFDRNSAVLLGGAIATTSIEFSPGVCFTDIINCSFYGNLTQGSGGAIHAQDSTGTNSVRIINSILWRDTAAVEASEIFNDRSTVSLTNSTIAGGIPAGIIDGGNNLGIDPLYADPENGDLHLPSCSPLIDIGDNSFLPGAISTDLDGDPRIHAGTVDLGAYEIGIIYVDQSASGANNGRSWVNAFNHFEDGLAAAAAGDQIWVAQGTYRPVACAPCTETDRESAFYLVPNVEAYGGFAGNETLLSQRDWEARPTILSGDIGVANDSLDNTFRVLIAENSTEKTILDGFIVEEGNADGSFGFSAGGGLYMDANPGGTANMLVRNCTFRNNYAGGGGGLAIDCVLGGESKAEIRNCIFENNTASLGVTSTGAAIFMQGNSGAQVRPRIVESTFRNNYCGNDGGAISATPTGEGSLLAMQIDSCLFTNNRSDDRGAAIWYRMSSAGESKVVIRNSQFLENNAGGEGGAIYARSSFDNIANDTIINCLFVQNSSDGSSTVNDGEGGAIFIRASQQGTRNHAIINSVFDRNSAALLGGAIATTSIEFGAGDCNVDILNCTFSGNNTQGDGGALHVEGSEGSNTMTISNSILWDNQASNNGNEIWNNNASVSLSYSDLAGGVPNSLNDAGNNLDADPQFKDAPGGDLHLGPCSPAIDAGSNDLLPVDLTDLDADGDFNEMISVDLDGFDRIFQSIVDMGAYEFDGSEPALTLNKNVTNESCGGACDGEVIVVPSGGLAGYTFNWSNGQATPQLKNLCAGTYYLTVKDASTCTLMDSITIEAGENLGLMVSNDAEICPGEETDLSATASGGVGTLTYNWNNELGTGNVQLVNPQTTTIYSVTVSDFSGCTETDSVTVSVVDPPTPVIQGVTTICPGSSTFLNTDDFSTYDWSNGAQTQEIEVNEAGTYRVTVTDENTCIGSGEIEVIEADSLQVNIQGDLTYCPGESTTLNAGSFTTYQWSTDENGPEIAVNTPGQYSVTVTDDVGCPGVATVEVVASDSLSVAILGDTTFCSGSSTILDAGNFASYLWSTGANSQQIEISEAGTYSLTVTNSAGCRGSATTTLTQNNVPVPTILGNLSICSGTSTMLDGGEFSTYTWSTGETSQQISVNTAGIFGLTVTDENGCSGSAEVVVVAADSLITSIQGPATFCAGSSTVLEGAPGFATYEWSTGSSQSSIEASEAGTYTLMVTDTAGCRGSATITLTQSNAPVPIVSGNLSICLGTSTTLNGGDFSSYAWSTGETSQQISVNTAGIFGLTVTDENGCSGSAEVVVVEADSLMISIQGSATFCPEGSTVLEGAPGFAVYEWSTGSSESSIEANEPGIYSLTVTDTAGCRGSATIEVSERMPLSPAISGNLSICPGASTTLDAGAFADYSWSTGAVEQRIEVMEPGTYRVTVTDDNGCSGIAEAVVLPAESLTPLILGSSTFCPGSTTILEGESGFSTYEWSTGSTDTVIEVSQPGTFSLTVTDLAGCSGSATIVVEEGSSLSPVINGSLTFCEGAGTQLSVGTFASYRWSTGATTQQINIVNSGVYSVTVSDASGCTGTAQVTAKLQSSPPPQISGLSSFCPGDSTILDGGPGYSSYLWSNGASTQRITVKSEGTYQLTVSDETGCTATDEVMVSFDLPDNASIEIDPVSCVDTLALAANLPPGTTGRWTSSDQNVAILDPMSPNTQATNFPENGVSLSWTLSTQDCPDYSRDELVLNPGLGPIANDDQAMIPATGPRSITIDLLLNDENAGAATPTLISGPSFGEVDGLVNGLLTYTAPEGAFGTVSLVYELCSAGCPCSSATVTMTIEAGAMEEMEVANTITPNGDGFNESFVFDIIRTTPPEAAPDNELIIFNRWGDIVFQMEDYDNTWNGVNNKGEALPEATYYYILRLNIAEGEIIRGDVTIIR